MRPESNSRPALARGSDRSRGSTQKLQDKPIPQHDPRWHIENQHKEPCKHLGARIKNQVRSHHSSDSSACSNRRGTEVWRHNELHDSSCEAAQNVEGDVLKVYQVLFDVIAKNPQEPHVPDHMGPRSMEEHGRKKKKKEKTTKKKKYYSFLQYTSHHT